MKNMKRTQKQKPVYHSCNIKFPDRVWEQTGNGWVSREISEADTEERKKVAESLLAELLT